MLNPVQITHKTERLQEDSVEDIVLRRITPDAPQKEQAKTVIDEVLSLLKKNAREMGIDAEPILVGSMAKDTGLSATDIDIFVMFPEGVPENKLQEYGLMLGESIVRGERRYAQHPYTHGEYKGFTLDIVPCYRITSPTDKMSAVDRTPFHTEFVKRNLRDEQKKEVRLLKQFLKGIGVYGAEIEIRGFSGYVCELLVIRYGSFENVIKEASGWRPGTIITIDVVGSESTHSPAFNDSLVIVDPVDHSRNAAAAVSVESLARFIHASKEYLCGKRIEFFFPKQLQPMNIHEIGKIIEARGTTLLGIFIHRPNVVDDVLYSQVRKCCRSIASLCNNYGFKVAFADYYVEGGLIKILLEVEIASLPAVEVHVGPAVWSPNAQDFLTRWNREERAAGPYILGDKWAVDRFRKYTTPTSLISEKLASASLGKDISETVVQGKYRILTEEDLLHKENACILTHFFDKRPPWNR